MVNNDDKTHWFLASSMTTLSHKLEHICYTGNLADYLVQSSKAALYLTQVLPSSKSSLTQKDVLDAYERGVGKMGTIHCCCSE